MPSLCPLWPLGRRLASHSAVLGSAAAGRLWDYALVITATASLARRIELAETSLVVGMGRCVADRLGEDEVIVAPIAGGAAVMPGRGSPLSKVAGLGFEPLDENALAAVEAEFARFGTPVRVELSSLGDPSLGKLLSSRGYLLSGFENVLGLPLPSPPLTPSHPLSAALTIERLPMQDPEEWIRVVSAGFMHPDTFDGPAPIEVIDTQGIDLIVRDLTALEGLSLFLARWDGTVAGGAGMRIAEGVAQLSGAATLPQHRRRGVQTALLGERLAAAAQAGCDIAVVTTEPGSKSQANAHRQGFELLYVRAVLIKPASA